MNIALATSAELETLGGTPEDRLLIAALQARGVEARLVAWSDTSADGHTGFDAVVLRTCWDYHQKVDAFLAWLTRLDATGLPIFNPTAVVRWNIDKRYLSDLAHRGAAVVPTTIVERANSMSLAQLFARHGGSSLVIKPTIGATASGTWRVSRSQTTASEERFAAQLAAEGSLLVQPFLEAIVDEGEWSLLFLDGELSHAVLKKPAPGDFRVQSDWGGSVERRSADDALMAAADRTLAAIGADLLYARVDLVRVDGRPLLMELELIEPELFLRPDSPELDLFRHGLLRRLHAAQPRGL